jgi:long-chain acyl-CoA synthetase
VDDVIRSGGESVYPDEVEAVLSTHPTIREAAVLGVPDPVWGEMVVACVVLNGTGTSWRDLDAHCRSSPLARFKRPRAYMMMESLPRNAANKLLRPTLRNLVTEARNMGQAGKLQLVDAS